KGQINGTKMLFRTLDQIDATFFGNLIRVETEQKRVKHFRDIQLEEETQSLLFIVCIEFKNINVIFVQLMTGIFAGAQQAHSPIFNVFFFLCLGGHLGISTLQLKEKNHNILSHKRLFSKFLD
ncbi:hypothetical protein ACJX0J_009892, partial [Zea mays]